MPDRDEIKEVKINTLLDIIRRTIANPQNAKEVAKFLAEDWNPLIVVTKEGKIKIDGF